MNRITTQFKKTILGAAMVVLSGQVHSAALTFSTSFIDPLGNGTQYYSSLTSHIGAALQSWGSFLTGSAHFEVSVEITNGVPRATGASATSVFLRNNGTYDVYEQGMAAELRTGVDPNGSAPDIVLQFSPLYLANELWFDPDPFSRTAIVPADRTDAASVLIHEIGHALAFNGWADGFTGLVPSNYESTWDENVLAIGGNLYFLGANAAAIYGGSVPVTLGNNFHIGNATGPGVDLVPDLMNGVVYDRGFRYAISDLDIAMLRDSGIQTNSVEEPTAFTLLALSAGIAVAVTQSRRKRRLYHVDA